MNEYTFFNNFSELNDLFYALNHFNVCLIPFLCNETPKNYSFLEIKLRQKMYCVVNPLFCVFKQHNPFIFIKIFEVNM